MDTSGPWYEVEGCYRDEPIPRFGSCEQKGMPLPSIQEQLQIFPISSQPMQDQINQQGIDYITQSTSLDSAPLHTLPKPSPEPRKSAGAPGAKSGRILRTGDGGEYWGYPFPLVEQEDDSSHELGKDMLLAFEQEKSELPITHSSPASHLQSL